MMHWKIKASQQGIKLGEFLKDALNLSGKAARRLVEAGHCRINSKTDRFVNTVLGAGDLIEADVEDTDDASEWAFSPERVLYDDGAILAYNKPPGLSSDEKSVLAIVKKVYPQAELVHRLDKGTSGILLFAQNPKMLKELEQLFKGREVHKTYLAIVEGKVKERQGKIENALGEIRRFAGQVIWGAVPEGKGLYACTIWKSLAVQSQASLLECYPETGRTHQIRVHLSGIGHPILGDHQYCKQFKCAYKPARILLHASKIEFPLANKLISITCPLPEDFVQALNALKLERAQQDP
jgi:RluA family pseudouridine synthase